jgi:spore coat protein U-like protein
MWIACFGKSRSTVAFAATARSTVLEFTMKHLVRTSVFIWIVFFTPFSSIARADVFTTGANAAKFNVTFNVAANCLIATKPLSFGSAAGLSLDVNDESALNVTCTDKTPYNIGLDAGDTPTSTVASRLLAGVGLDNASSTVAFQLYKDATRKIVWGNTQGTDTLTGLGSGNAQSFPVYGQVPGQSVMPVPGNYQSVITATVSF